MLPIIVTIAAGEEINYRDITIPRMKDYAHKVGADFWVIDRAQFGDVIDADTGQPGGATYWKIPLIEWLGKQETYHSMLYLDADVFVKRDAPDIFSELGHMDSLAIAKDMHSERELPLWEEWASKHYRFSTAFLPERVKSAYFNAGVFLMRPAAAYRMRQFRNHFPDIHSQWQDQGLVNCWAKSMPTDQLAVLAPCWNVPYPYATQDPNAGHFLHACGINQADKLAWFQKLESLGI